MKKRILTLASVLALVAVLLVPATALAAVTVSLSDSLVNATDVDYTIGITTETAIDPLVDGSLYNAAITVQLTEKVTDLSGVAQATDTDVKLTLTSEGGGGGDTITVTKAEITVDDTNDLITIPFTISGDDNALAIGSVFSLVISDVVNPVDDATLNCEVKSYKGTQAEMQDDPITTGLIETLTETYAITSTSKTGAVTGSVSSAEVAPSVTTLGISPAATMTPQSDSTLTIEVSDTNTLADVASIKVWVGLDETDINTDLTTKTSSDCDAATLAIFEWDSSSQAFKLIGPQDTTWSVTSTTNPGDYTVTQDNFVLVFQPGKVARYAQGSATYAGWDIMVQVLDGSGGTGDDKGSLDQVKMNALGEVKASPSGVSFGSLAPGSSTKPITNPGSGYFTAICLVNKDYSLQINTADWKSSDDAYTLSLVSSLSGTKDEFILEVDDNSDQSDLQTVTTSALTITNHSDDGPSVNESESDASNTSPVYLWITLSESVDPVTFSGTITMTAMY